MQDDKGLRALFGLPKFYGFFQRAVGADYCKNWFIRECLRPKPGDKMLDIGCGTGDILDQLPAVKYAGIDISQPYILAAQKSYGARGLFLHGTAELHRGDERLKDADLVTCIGLLHHLDDHETRLVLSFARENLKPGGRFVSIEPCFLPHQTSLSRWIMSKDRGQNVRLERDWRSLLQSEFPNSSSQVMTGLLRLPYVHVILEGTK
jgi:SAM-dependent methyltransferase